MIGLTPVFHIFSLLSLIALAWWISELTQQMKFARRLWQYARNEDVKGIWVDWPHRFVRRFCLLCGAEFEISTKAKKPCRLAPKAWIEVDRLLHIKKVLFDGQDILVYVSSETLDEQCLWARKQLARSFKGEWSIQVAKDN